MVALNFSAREQRVTLPALGDGPIVISIHLDQEEPVNLGKLILRDNEGVIVELPS